MNYGSRDLTDTVDLGGLIWKQHAASLGKNIMRTKSCQNYYEWCDR